MHGYDILVRKSDGKTFEVATHGHWSEIVSQDGERDSVKWLGGDGTGLNGAEYVSHSAGHHYHIDPAGRSEERFQAHCTRQRAKYGF